MMSFEYNVIQGATGDMIVVGRDDRDDTGRYSCRSRLCAEGVGEGPWGNRRRYDPKGVDVLLTEWTRLRRADVDFNWQDLGTQAVSPNENPVGEWNRVELVCDGDTSKHYFNGKLVAEFTDLRPAAGRIQLQSEAQGVEYRNIVIEPIIRH